MVTIEQESEALQISRYCEIIMQILATNKILTLIKLITFAYILKNKEYLKEDVYMVTNDKDVIFKCLSIMSGLFNEFAQTIPYIIKAIHLLKINNMIDIKDNIITPTKIKTVLNQMYDNNTFIYKAIESSKKMSDRQFLKEVITNV